VRHLQRRGDLTAAHPAMRSVGYRQLWAYLEGSGTLTDAVSRAIAATRQLAKRQLTWLRGAASGEWIDPDETGRVSWIRDISTQLRRFGL
jgi:tRNA dimethylallyltransferase